MTLSSRNLALQIAVILVSLRRAGSFCHLVASSRSNRIAVKKYSYGIVLYDCCCCCEDCSENDTVDCISGQPCHSNALLELPSIPIHTSRRNFVQYTAATLAGFASLPPTSPAIAASVEGSTFTADAKNLIAVPGQLAPFSTTRSYRNIVLSNGLKVVLVKDTMAKQSSAALSIDGAGQFAEPDEIPGLAHLMEHIVLSSSRRRTPKFLDRKARRLWNNGDTTRRVEEESKLNGEEDFEDWLTENDGDSNAFTAPGFVCFHFNGPHEILPEGLERFSKLFTLDEVETTVAQKPYVIPREIGRVTEELDSTSDASRAFYFLKQNINPEHPFARFSAGSKTTLQTIPAEKGIDICAELLLFFREHYLASKATLVVVSKNELSALDRWISPFSNVMAQRVRYSEGPSFPDPMIGKSSPSNSIQQTIILRSKEDNQVDENFQTLCVEWPLSLVYKSQAPTQNIITATGVGFVLNQVLSRRGPGSLRLFLEKFGWAQGSKGVPRISFPVDVSGFQVLRMEIGLTLDGFANRSAVVCAVFESIRKVLEKPLQLDLIKQYLAGALLHGYMFAPRPPDAIALSVDSLRYGIGGMSGIGNANSNWYLMPSPEDELGAENMRQVITDTLQMMSNDKTPLVSFRASPKAIFGSSGGIIDQSISTPPVFSPWKVEPITGARYFVENRAVGASSYFNSLYWISARFDGDELSPPYLNPLLPTKFRAPRPVIERQAAWGRRYFYLEEASAAEPLAPSSSNSLKLTDIGSWREMETVTLSEDPNWKIWQIPPARTGFIGLPLPVRPPEPSVECAFVIQLLSSLPSTFTNSQLALMNLWQLSFDEEILDLAELGATAGIAYETSLNTSGLRLSFRGVSQTLPSYVRRLCRRLVQHHAKLLDGSTKISESVYQRAISDAKRSPMISDDQRLQMIETFGKVSDKDIAKQALFFLRCTSGGYLVSQGDVLPNESRKLASEVRYVFRDFGAADGFAVEPDLRDLLYRPIWKPRNASPCLLPGITLISDACGRIPR